LVCVFRRGDPGLRVVVIVVVVVAVVIVVVVVIAAMAMIMAMADVIMMGIMMCRENGSTTDSSGNKLGRK
jgi:hypothetical protein